MTAPAVKRLRADEPPPHAVELTIIAQDPEVKVEGGDGRIVTARVSVPAEHLEPGPRGARFHVVDYDPASGKFEPPAVLIPGQGDPFGDPGINHEVLTQDPAFRAQNVYAIAARTLAAFEGALGRRLSWGFQGHQLFLVPRAFPEANAYYDPDDGAVYFGFVPTGEGTADIQAALSHDIIAHETTHAILDGLRHRFLEPSLPDQDAFHEALGDIVALLSVFSVQEVVEHLLGSADAGQIAAERLTQDALAQSALLGLADHFSLGEGGERGSALRRSISLDPKLDWRGDPAFNEPHKRGEVLVAATMQALRGIWFRRLEALVRNGTADRARVAEDGAKAAGHLLQMMIRGIDYMPAADLEFEDVLGAVLTADEVLAPDGQAYREALGEAFAAFGIAPRRPVDLTVQRADGKTLRYERMNFDMLSSDRDEVARFLWENAEVLGINREYRLRVDSVRPAVRVGPDGLVVAEVVADYVQSVEMTVAELKAIGGIDTPAQIAADDPLQLWGGGALVFDQFGRAKWHHAKPVTDWDRQRRRLEYLVEHSLRDTSGRFGFGVPGPRGQRFAAMHQSDQRAGEDW